MYMGFTPSLVSTRTSGLLPVLGRYLWPSTPSSVGTSGLVLRPWLVGTWPSILSLAGNCPSIQSLVGSWPSTPSLEGNCPYIPSLVGAWPSTASLFGNWYSNSFLVDACHSIPFLVGASGLLQF